jgi:small subunit ribosomal protein S21
MSQVNLHKGETVDKALKRLRKLTTREGTLKTARDKRFFKKPSKVRYENDRRNKYNQRVRSRDEW